MIDRAPELFLDGRVALHAGDCLDVLRALPAESVHAVITDPPYHLTSIVKRFGGAAAAPARDYRGEKPGATGAYARASRGFMGKTWDGGDIAFRVELWAEIFRVLKPGGFCAAFSATRTYHRMATAIEDAGFEIRDCLAWMYATGFPKSLDVSKALDKAAGAVREVIGVRRAQDIRGGNLMEGASGAGCRATEYAYTAPSSDVAREWQGWGTALKPAFEPICLARKPLSERNVAANVLAHGCGALNIDAARIATSAADQAAMQSVARFSSSCSGGEAGIALSGSADGSLRRSDRSAFDASRGRWPANVVHDGSPEVMAAFPAESGGGGGAARLTFGIGGNGTALSGGGNGAMVATYADSGSAARFFFSAKASKFDRIKSKHPTVKPVELMRWLVRLLTPPGGIVLDPFAGTGTTGQAAYLEGFSAVLIEREADYRADIARRMALTLAGPEEKARALIEPAPHDDLPLFGG